MKNDNIKNLTIVSLFIAFIFVATKIEIRLTPDMRFHLGNSMCLLAGFLLNPFYAGLSSGLGSMFYDLMFYPNGIGFIITFFTKFAMGFMTSFCLKKISKKIKNDFIDLIIAGIVGQISYIILYMLKTFIERRYVLSMPIEPVIVIMISKLSISITNGIVAIIISIVVYQALSKNIILKKFF